jgi:hypothetical protein
MLKAKSLNLLDKFLPSYHFNEVHSIKIAASPSEVEKVLREFDFSGSRLIKLLFAVRGLPPNLATGIASLEQMGFVVLGQEDEKEIVFGLIGKFWTTKGDIVRVTKEEFTSFPHPGYAKAAWNFLIDPIISGECILSTETRIICADEDSKKFFSRYWFIIKPFSRLIRKEMLKQVKKNVERTPVLTS